MILLQLSEKELLTELIQDQQKVFVFLLHVTFHALIQSWDYFIFMCF